jgi:L-iditol 2-dehydrogenase
MAETSAAHAVLSGIESIVVERRTVLSPGPGQVRIRVHSVGICGSDLHYFKVRPAAGSLLRLVMGCH